MMIINKSNQSVIDTGNLNIHDAVIDMTHLDISSKTIVLTIKLEDNHKLIVNFKNVFDFTFSSWNIVQTSRGNEIYGWEGIPNSYTKDNYIDEVKKKVVVNSGEWNDDLFAIRILFTNMGEIKIVCETIVVE
jgi:hypothetical protein